MKTYKFEFNEKTYKTHYCTSPEDFVKAVKYLEKTPRKLYGLDIETAKLPAYKTDARAGLCPHLSSIRLIQIYDGRRIFVFDTAKIYNINTSTNPRDVSKNGSKRGADFERDADGRRDAQRRLGSFLSSRKFIAHNAIFEIKHFQQTGIEVDCVCSMIMAQFVETAKHSPFEPRSDKGEQYFSPMKGFGLASLVQRYFGIVISKEQQKSDWSAEVLSPEQINYAAIDAFLTYDLGKHLYPEISSFKMKKAFKLYKDMQYVIADMELNGMAFDKKAHAELIKTWDKKIIEIEKKSAKYFGDVNLRSSKQMNEWVVKRYSSKPKILAKWPKTKTGSYSFNKNDLFDFTGDPAIKLLLEYKKYATLSSTFGTALAQKINPRTKRIHCSFSLGHTRTGRLSSRDPNLQNMPARGDSFRHIFVAEPDNVLVVADFSQVEIRVAGELSKDPAIRGAYKEGLDLHKAIVAKLESKSIKDVTNDERQLGKAINFGLQFGMGAKKLALYARTSYGVEMSEQAAQKAWNAYHTEYAVYSKWCKDTRRKAEQVGWVRTPMGKVRALAQGEYYTKAINTPVQGGAAEVMFTANIELRRLLKGTDIRFINVVHDECIIECSKKDIPDAISMLEVSMLYGFKKVFPEGISRNLVEANSGKTWAAAK